MTDTNLEFFDRQIAIHKQHSKSASETGNLKEFELAEREVANYEKMKANYLNGKKETV